MARERDDDYEDDTTDRPARRRDGGGGGETVKNYLVQSILVTLCCCLPLGIVAILSAIKVNPFVAEGNMSAAREASAAAKKWSTYGAIAGLVINGLGAIVYIIIGVVAVGAGAK